MKKQKLSGKPKVSAFFAYSETTFNLVSYTLEIGDSFEFGRG